MRRLVKLQLRNIFQGKLFYICLALMILLGPVAAHVLGNTLSDIVKDVNICSEILSLLSVGIIETVFIALVSCSDFNDGTTKNIIGRGYTRTQLLFSKYIAIFISLIIMFGVTTLALFIVLHGHKLGYDSKFLYQLLNHFASIVAYIVFYTTMSFLVEKNGSAILACLFVPQLLPAALVLLNKIMPFDINKLWMEHGTDLFEKKPTLGNLGLSVLYYAVYIIIFIVIGTQVLKRKEIK